MAAPSTARYEPLVGGWLLLIVALVAAMIVIGGATRLTDSGLSITEWNFAKGVFPPQTTAAWQTEFELYRATTEYQLQNRGMSLEDFKVIYAWEWGHRFFGKLIGAVFGLGFFAFWASGRLAGRFWPALGLFALGALQGYIGWWMVESGLAGRLDVAAERLAVHLGMAFAIIAGAWLLALSCFGWPRRPSALGAPSWLAWVLAGAVLAQVLAGALVAGVDAGKAYAEWPTINGAWIPAGLSAAVRDWPGFAQDHAALQFVHRTLGYIVALLAAGLGAAALARGVGAGRGAGLLAGVLALSQAGLGVAVVLGAAPFGLSLAHQGLAIALWLAVLTAARAAWR